MNRMLINASQDEWRIALTEGSHLLDLDIEFKGQEQTTANIYKGKVSRIEPSLEAAFVDYGGNRHGFLPIKEIAPEYYPNGIFDRSLEIKNILQEGQQIIVQVEKEERGNKGAALTTYITLAGCYLVLMPNNPEAGGISRRIEGEEREELRSVLDALQLPAGMGVIIRTAGVGKSIEELQWDLTSLLNVWNAIKDSSDKGGKAPFLIHQESDAIIRAVRDYLRLEVEEIIVDSQEAFSRLHTYIERVRPEYVNKIKLHQDKVPLFSFYQIESQTETVFQRRVRLPSGGEIVIDQTEALVSIDINSSRSTKGGDIEETALNTNLEAADEIARQLRLRDFGGLVIIDFIDMVPMRNKRAVEKRLRDALRHDRARVQVGNISHFGILEMSRQRLRSSLHESRQLPCPRCHGQGIIRGVLSLASSLIHLLEEHAAKESTAQIRLEAPIDVATYLFNEKRPSIVEIEKRHNITILIIANPHLQTPDYQLKDITVHEYATSAHDKSSYELVSTPEAENIFETKTEEKITKAKKYEPRVKPAELPTKPAPKAKVATGGLLSKIFKHILGGESQAEKATTPTKEKKATEHSSSSMPRSPRHSTQERGNRSGGNRQRRDSSERREPSDRREPRESSSEGNQYNKPRHNRPRSNDDSGAPRKPNHRNARPNYNNERNRRTSNTPTPAAEAPVIADDQSTPVASLPIQHEAPMVATSILPAVSPIIEQPIAIATAAAPVAPAKQEEKKPRPAFRAPPPPPVSSSLLEGDANTLMQVETAHKKEEGEERNK